MAHIVLYTLPGVCTAETLPHGRACRGVRTTDSTPPIIAALSATWAPPLNFTVVVTVSKPGRLLLIARRWGWGKRVCVGGGGRREACRAR
jgi:hypothetical protein